MTKRQFRRIFIGILNASALCFGKMKTSIEAGFTCFQMHFYHNRSVFQWSASATSDIVMLYSNDATSRMNEHWCWSLPTYTYELHPTAIIQNNSKQNAMRIAAFLCSMQLDSCSARRLCPTLLMFHTECPMSVQSSIYTEWIATIVSNEMQCIYLLLFFFFIHFSQS